MLREMSLTVALLFISCGALANAQSKYLIFIFAYHILNVSLCYIQEFCVTRSS